MASKLNSDGVHYINEKTAALDKCISIFKTAKTDNERFAALLLVTRLVQSNSIDSSQRRLLYDAIGFTFINRLLKTKSSSEQNMYLALALVILACFATDKELLLHPQMIAKIELLNEIITSPPDDKSIVDDAYQILEHFSSTVEGCRVLSSKGTVSCLCNIIMSEHDTASMAWKVLLNASSLDSTNTWKTRENDFIKLVIFCADKLKDLQDSDKFMYCSNLMCLLSNVDTEYYRNAMTKCSVNTDQLLSIMVSGLSDILQGKVTSSQRDPAIVFVSVMLDLLDDSKRWAFLTKSNLTTEKADFFVLIATTVGIEIRMILDESTIEEMIVKTTLLTSCYNILENVISCLITMTDSDTQETQSYKPDKPLVNAIYSQITDSMMSVLGFLQQESVKYEENLITTQDENDLVLASVRVLLAWMAEESMALEKEVKKVLPFLIKLAKDTLHVESPYSEMDNGDSIAHSTEQNAHKNKREDIEVIRFMLPALCHLSSDDKSRKVLIDNGVSDILYKYYLILWKRCEVGATDSQTALTTLLGIFLNFAVTEEHLVKNGCSFKQLLTHISANAMVISDSHLNIDLFAHFIVLGLMLLRYQKENANFLEENLLLFLKAVVVFLKEANKLQKVDNIDESISSSVKELWFLGVQVLLQEFKDPNQLIFKCIPDDLQSDLMSLSNAAWNSQQ